MPPTSDLYQLVTDQIIAALEAGTPPWLCPWNKSNGGTSPANLSTGRPYRGINTLLLNLRAMSHGYPLNRWLTYQQARGLGGHVRRGEAGTQIVFFKMLDIDETKAGTRAANDEPSRKVVPLLRGFSVFNAAQVEGLPAQLVAPPASDTVWQPIDVAEALLARSGAVIRHGGDHAYYNPSQDYIQLPPAALFPQAGGYYGVALHELTHWTGHPTRCNRPLVGRQHIEAYAFEELVAEMGAAFLCSNCGVRAELQHAGYIASWLKALRDDKRLIFSAASLAQKSADFVLQPLPNTEAAQTATQAA